MKLFNIYYTKNQFDKNILSIKIIALMYICL